MDSFVRWLDDGAFTPYGYAYDIGRGTMSAIHRYKRSHKPLEAGNIDERSNGNGSLMRIMPAVLYCIQHHLSDSEAIDIIHKVGSLTHGHIRSNIACGLYCFMASAILNEEGSLTSRLQAGLDKGFAFYEAYLTDHENLEYYDRLRNLDSFGDLPENSIRSTGYVVDTLEAAVWSLVNTDSFADTLLKAVNLGYDTDTAGAVTGMAAGILYGRNGIPQRWMDRLQKRDELENYARDFAACYPET
jgi:ADP-ribosylglycohydrolase